MRALEEAGMRSPTRSLILGAGGAARAVGAALVAAHCSVTLAARNREQAAAVAARLATEQVAVSAIQLHPRPILEILEGCDLLVNATTVGANPGPGECPLPAEVDLHPGVLVFDLVYGAAPTELLRRAGRAGCRTVPGVEMLVHQAAQSLEIWSGRPAPIEVMREAAREFLRRPREDA
jgi:shikimate dehydrogenase